MKKELAFISLLCGIAVFGLQMQVLKLKKCTINLQKAVITLQEKVLEDNYTASQAEFLKSIERAKNNRGN